MKILVCNRRPSKAFVRRPGFGPVIAIDQVQELSFYPGVHRRVCLMLQIGSPAMPFASKCQLVEERCNASYLKQYVNRYMWNVSHVMQIIEFCSSLTFGISSLSLIHCNNFSFLCSLHTILLVPKRVYVCSRRRRPADRAFF